MTEGGRRVIVIEATSRLKERNMLRAGLTFQQIVDRAAKS